jgi:hypothetical protein
VIFCSDPVPITGNIRCLEPSFTTLRSSSATRTEIPALPSVSSTTTPWLVPASGCAVAAGEGAALMVRDRDKATTAAGMIEHFMGDHPYPSEPVQQARSTPQTPANAGCLKAKRVCGGPARARAIPWCSAIGYRGHRGQLYIDRSPPYIEHVERGRQGGPCARNQPQIECGRALGSLAAGYNRDQSSRPVASTATHTVSPICPSR